MFGGEFLIVSFTSHQKPAPGAFPQGFLPDTSCLPTALQQNPDLAARDVIHSHIANVPIKFAKRNTIAATEKTKRDTIDAVNLNVDTSNECVTMTFVETVDDEGVEDEE